MHIVGNIESTIWSRGEACRSERRLPRLFHSTSEPIGKHDKVARCFAILERLEHHIVPALRLGRSIPRTMEGYECATWIGRRKSVAFVDQEIIGRPVSGESRDGVDFVSADTDLLTTVATVFWR